MQNLSIYCGTIKHRLIDGQDFISAIDKLNVSDSLMLTPLGLEGDEQAEKKVHGGPDRALCHYPQEHYAYWQAQFPQSAERFTAPAFGENISTLGMTEDNVYMGDIYQWGEALIQVTQPRSPCYKLNRYFGIENIAPLLQQTGRCGWLYRVISAGKVNDKSPLVLRSRLSDVSVQEAIAIAFHLPFDAASYHRLLSVAGLSASWAKTMQNRLLHQTIESFELRLLGRK